MGFRDSLRQKSGGVWAGIGLIMLASFIVIWNRRSGIPANLTETYFSDDDGATYFADDINKLYPFDHNGKPAYRAYVYKCSSGTPFVGYLERLTDAAKAKIAELRQKPPEEIGNQVADAYGNGTEVKKPGSGKWVSSRSADAGDIVRPKCPDGSADLKGVYP